MKISRRNFVKSATLFGAACCGGGAAWADGSGKERLRMGVLSDIHIRCDKPEQGEMFRKALEYFRDRGVDAVLLAGDIADTGRVAELEICANVWYSVFPNGKAPDGRPVEHLFVLGNHCVDGWRNPHYRSPSTDEQARLADAIGYADVRQKTWRRLFHEDFQPIWMKTVKGYPVIGAHWEKSDGGIRIEEFMKAHAKEIDPSLPFFYTQHEHPKDTVMGPWAWGHDDGRSTRALAAFPNAVAFSGHSHYSLTDERSIWQGAFTSINASSLYYGSNEYALRENGRDNAFGYTGEKRARRMKALGLSQCRQGQFVTVYDDRIDIDRLDFISGMALGDKWVLPLPVAEKKPFDFAVRRAARVAPEFASGAKVSVAIRKNGEGAEFVDVTFPHAETKNKCRVFEYEVTAALEADEVDLIQAQRRVLAPDFYSLDEPSFHRSGLCTFLSKDLTLKGPYRFTVRPIECFGAKGRPIASELVKIA